MSTTKATRSSATQADDMTLRHVYLGTLCVLLTITGNLGVSGSTGTSGTHFLVTFPYNESPLQPEVIVVPQSSRSLPVHVTLSFPVIGGEGGGGGTRVVRESLSTVVTSLDVANITIRLPDDVRTTEGSIETRGVYINTSEAVQVFAVNWANHLSDSFLVPPVTALGRQYYVTSYNPESMHRSRITIAALHNNTTVNITLPTHTQLPHLPPPAGGLEGAGGGWWNYQHNPWNQTDVESNNDADTTATFDLNRLQTMQMSRQADMTGTRITASDPIAVVSSDIGIVPDVLLQGLIGGNGRREGGSGGAGYGNPIRWLDMSSEFVLPVEKWGQHFVAVALQRRDRFKILAGSSQTFLEVKRSRSTSSYYLQAGECAELSVPYDGYVVISSNKPVLVTQHVTTRTRTAYHRGSHTIHVPAVTHWSRERVVFPVLFSNQRERIIYLITDSRRSDGVLIDGHSLSSYVLNAKIVAVDRTVINTTFGSYVVVRVRLRNPGVYTVSHRDGVKVGVVTYSTPGGLQFDEQFENRHTQNSQSFNVPYKHISDVYSSVSYYDTLPVIRADIADSPEKNPADKDPENYNYYTDEVSHLGEGFNATLIAVIASLGVAIFFVLVCIGGFVFKETACTGETIFSGAKVTPIEIE